MAKTLKLERRAITKMQAIIIAAIIIIAAVAVGYYYLTLPPPAPPAEELGNLKATGVFEGQGVQFSAYYFDPDGIQSATFTVTTAGYTWVDLPVGTYTVHGSYGEYTAEMTTTVVEGQTTTVTLDFGAPTPVKYGGTLVMVGDIEPEGLSPLTTYYQHLPATVMFTVFENLMDPDIEDITSLVPHLAESWEAPDNVTYIFHLRQGVKFHDGEPFNAEAVAKNFKFYNETLGRGVKLGMDHWEVLDTYTIKLVYEEPRPIALLEWAWFSGMVSPKAYEDMGEAAFARKPIGTGPFKFVRWIPGDSIILERFEDYWGEKPYIDKIVLRIIPEATTRVLEFESGNIDIIDYIGLYPHLSRLQATGKYRFVTAGAMSQRVFLMNMRREPWNNKLVRQAVSYAIDRQGIADAIYYGWGSPAVGPIRIGFTPYYKPELKKYDYNLQMAEDLLDQAGFPRGPDGVRIRTTILAAPYSYWADIAVIIQDNLRAVGIEAELEVVEKAIFSNRVYVESDFDLASYSWGGSGDHPWGWLFWMHSKEMPKDGAVGWNLEGINDTRIDALIDELVVTEIGSARALEITTELQEIEIEEAYRVHTVDPLVVHVTQSYVEGYVVHPWWPKAALICVPTLGVNVYFTEARG